MAGSDNFAVLRAVRRVWAVASIHGEAERLRRLHAALETRLLPGDRLVYLGNVLGRGPAVRPALDMVLAFRRAFLARRGAFVGDVALLRGAQEEMWQKLLQLQFSIDPGEVLGWVLDQGVGATIEAYGGRVNEGFDAVRQGTLAITRWTAALRRAFQAVPGHQAYLSALSHAALTADGALLFVSRGVAPDRPLDAQSDAFWWGARGFDGMAESYGGFRLVVRGFDPAHRGIDVGPVAASIDAGCGFGGGLAAACLTPDGEIVDVVEV